MPQSTNLNTPPYFEDFDPKKKFNKVLFKPGVPLQARELTTLQSILQDQVEKLGSSIYKEGAMVIPGQIAYDLSYTSVLIEDEYFGLASSQLVDFIVGKTITGQSSGVKAKVVNALTAEQSEKGFTTLFIKYITAADDFTSASFEDDEILIANESFSIGGTVITENTDFAKCITRNATFTGSSSSITSGVYYTKGYFVSVDSQEIVLDQFGITPSYRIGLQVLETIVSSSTDESLNDPSQGFSNFAAPGADRFKLDAKLVKKSLSDNTVTDFIELLRLENGKLIELENGNLNQLDNLLENTLARRTFDESGNYEVEPYIFTKEECLDNGVNNGVYQASSTTADGNTASKDLFEIVVSPGKSYVLGYELTTTSTEYVDIEKARKFKSIEDFITNTDARGFVITLGSPPPFANLSASLTGNRIIALRDDSNAIIGYGILLSVQGNDIRLTAIRYLSEKSINNLSEVVIGGTIDFVNNTVAGGAVISVSSTSGSATPKFFKLYQDNVIKSVDDISLTDIRAFASDTLINGSKTFNNVPFNSDTLGDYEIVLEDTSNVGTITVDADLQNRTLTVNVGNTSNSSGVIVFGPQTIANPTERLLQYKPMTIARLNSIANRYDINGDVLSLGITRVCKIRGVYIGNSTATPADTIPNITLTSNLLLQRGEIIEGGSSGAKGRVADINGTQVYFVYENDNRFIPNETIKSYETQLTGNVSTIVNGTENVQSKFKLNDGQTLNTFEFSSIEKINNSFLINDTSRIFVIYDVFQDTNYGNGTFTTVNSFYNADLDKIPSYIFEGEEIYLSDIIDFRLDQSDVVTGDGTAQSPFLIQNSEIELNTDLFNYGNNNYQVLPNNQVIPEGYAQTDTIEYYIPTKNILYLSKNGEFTVKSFEDSLSNSSENVYAQKNSMPLIDIEIPAYTRDLNKVIFSRYKNNRYTMKDIGEIESRIDNVEYYTQLSLLESDTSNLFIPDSNGNNRLKNGFLVDNFTSHDVGEPRHPNYLCSMDFSEGELRPQHHTTNISLKYKNDIEPSNYLKNNFILLNYTDFPIIEQSFASGAENVNPFAVISWIGDIIATPATDDWIDEIRLPETTTNVEGNFLAEALQAGVTNFRTGGFAPTQWNAWQTTWSSTRRSSSTRRESRATWPFVRTVTTTSRRTTRRQTRTGIRTNVTPRTDRRVLGDRVVDTTYARWKRSRNIRFIGRRFKPFIEVYPFFDGRDISTYTTPKLVEIVMLDGQFEIGEDISLVSESSPGRFFRATLVPPSSGPNEITFNTNPYTKELNPNNYTQNSNLLNFNVVKTTTIGNNQGGYLLKDDIVRGENSGARARITNKRFITNESGDLITGFFIPDPNIDGNPRWKVGESVIRFTDSPTNSFIPGDVDSAGEGTFTASGTILSKQSDVLLVRNAQVRRDTVRENRVVTSRSSSTRTGAWVDPLAQSFLVPEVEGMFITKIDTYFQQKDSSGLPVTMEIRTMVNGYPSPTVIGKATLTPDDVNVSDDASAVTTFTLDTPTYVEGLREYCFAILTSSVEYKMWISSMGQDDLNGNRITAQPYAGVLFKSQNASTWTAHQLDDLKFKLYRAEFDISETPEIEFENDASLKSTTKRLPIDPIELLLNTQNVPYSVSNPKSTTGYIKINHPNHGMHDPASFVAIDGVTSGVETTLAADWNGTIGTAIPLTGGNTVESLFKNTTLINGAAPSSTNLAFIRIRDAVYSYDASQANNTLNGTFTITLTGLVSGSIPSNGYNGDDDIIVEYYIVEGVPLTEINKTHTNLRWITLDSYQIFIDKVRNITDNISFGGSRVTATTNTLFTSVMPQVTYQEFSGTSITGELRTTSGTSLSTSSFSDPNNSNIPPDRSYLKEPNFSFVNLNENNYYETTKLIASNANSINLMQNQSSVGLKLKLSSNTTKLSPIIDAERVSLITTSNRISNINGNYKKEYFGDNPGETFTNIELNPLTDYNNSNYITKLVNLQNPATALRIELAAYNPATIADIDVLIKVLSGEESDPNQVNWINLDDAIFSNSNRRGNENFVDQKWDFDITDLTPNGKAFTSFQVKIRMRSSTQSFPPLIKDLRCIALA